MLQSGSRYRRGIWSTRALSLFTLLGLGACSSDGASNPGSSAPDGGVAGGAADAAAPGATDGAAAASGTVDAAPGAGPRPPAGKAPAELTAAGISAFLQAGEHTKGSWISETPAPRDRSSSVSPHGNVRVWMNDLMVASLRAGKSTNIGTPPADQFSMAVKELYDDEKKTLLGRAVMLKADDGALGNAWIYYCYGPGGNCFNGSAERTIDNAYFGRGFALNCGSCHGGLIFTKPPMP